MILRDKLGVTVLLKNRCCLRFFKTVGLGLDHNRAQTFSGSFNALSALKDLPNWRSERKRGLMRVVGMTVGEGMQVFIVVDGVLTEVLTVETASYHYNYAKTTLRQWADEGKLIAYKLAGILLIDKASLEHFLKRDFATQSVAE
jgi:hypothetical protein